MTPLKVTDVTVKHPLQVSLVSVETVTSEFFCIFSRSCVTDTQLYTTIFGKQETPWLDSCLHLFSLFRPNFPSLPFFFFLLQRMHHYFQQLPYCIVTKLTPFACA